MKNFILILQFYLQYANAIMHTVIYSNYIKNNKENIDRIVKLMNSVTQLQCNCSVKKIN